MKTIPRNWKFFAGFILMAIALWDADAISRIFQTVIPIAFDLTTGSFHSDDAEEMRAVESPVAAAFQPSSARTAPTWFINAMPGYSSSRARELWYLSLNRAGDRELKFDQSSSADLMTTNPYRAFQGNLLTPSLSFSRAPVSTTAMIAPSAPPGSGSAIPALTTTILSPSSVNGPAAWNGAVNGDWNNDANWSPASPNGIIALALFGLTNNPSVSISAQTQVADIIFGSSAANAYTITATAQLRLTLLGAGVTNNSSVMQNFVAQSSPGILGLLSGSVLFENSATAGNNRVTYTAQGGGNYGSIIFISSSTGGTANFFANANAGAGGTGGVVQFLENSSADHAIVTANGSTVSNPNGNRGRIDFFDTADAGAATLIANGGIGPLASPTGGEIRFMGNSTGGTARVELFGNGRLNLASHNSTGTGPHVTIGSLEGDGYVLLAGLNLGIGSANTSTTFSGSITGDAAGGTTGSITKVGTGVLLLSGASNYTGNTTVAAGELMLGQTGSLATTSTIRLGDTAPNSPSALFSFGPGTGMSILNDDLIVQASASGTEGTRTILSLAANGNSNLLATNIVMNTDLTVQSAAAGSTVANGPGTLHLSGTTDVLNHTFEVNSNLRGNNADTYSIQGTVLVTGPLTSTLATGGSVVKDGSGTFILFFGNNQYTGTDAAALNPNGTQIRGGILSIWGDGTLGLAPTNATNNIFFQASAYNTNSDSIGPTLQAGTSGITLAATRNINIASGVTGSFDSNGNTFGIAGVINGDGNLRKIGAGTLALTGANTYTGTTTINAGTLNAATAKALGSTSHVTVNSGGTLFLSNSGTIDRINNSAGVTLNGNGSATASMNTGGLSEYTVGSVLPGMGALTLQSSSIIDLGSGASILAFSSSLSQAANWNGTLSIYNWSGTLLTGNGTDQLYFGTDTTGLSPTQLLQISFYSDNGSTFLGFGSWGTDLDGEVVPLAPVPEPATWIGAALALAAIVFTQRRRFAEKLITPR